MTNIDEGRWMAKLSQRYGGSDGITHIIEYQNQFDGRTAWKLCRSKEMYEYAMAAGSFIEPKLIWTQEETT